MFDNNSNVFSNDFTLQLDDIVKAICDISFDIGMQLQGPAVAGSTDAEFSIKDLFKDEFVAEMSIRPERLTKQIAEDGTEIKPYTNDEFFALISQHYNDNLVIDKDFIAQLNGSDILFVDKKDTRFISTGERAHERLMAALKKVRILKQLISKLKSDKIQKSLEKIDIFETDILYKGAISTEQRAGQPVLAIIGLDFIENGIVATYPVDKEHFWFNEDKYAKLSPGFENVTDTGILKAISTGVKLGIVVNQKFLLPEPGIDLSSFIKRDRLEEYYFLLFEKTYSKKVRKLGYADSSLIEFKALSTDVALNQLLSHLKNNFYIANPALIEERFKIFFNSVIHFEKLALLKDYQFLLSSSIEEETLLGVYSDTKIGTEYNLLHWLNHEGIDKARHFRGGTEPEKKAKKLVSTLKPAICYYFLEKYFEDLVEKALQTNNYQFLSNITLLENKKVYCEVDFLVLANKKFYYVEAKTKLSRYYIDDFLKKSSKIIDKLQPMIDQGIEVHFVLLSSYSDKTVTDYQFFIDEHSDKKESGYNETRSGLNCLPYHFQVPIPDKEGQRITCVAEPEFDKLQKILLSICPK
ncbi:hypothetical protein [Fluviicola taffensis]|uniref:hypothetical protein n=1 Tax=Fluviicola taffensis TaxID=191579 RepID=UPI003137F60F